MAKEGIFNVIEHTWEMDGLNILDLFAGTGSISLEFCSRGAGRGTAIDQNSRCTELIQKALRTWAFPTFGIRHDVFIICTHSGYATKSHLPILLSIWNFYRLYPIWSFPVNCFIRVDCLYLNIRVNTIFRHIPAL
jgi:hypothetical protein